MSDSGITGDDEVAVGDDGRGFEEIPGVINLILAADKTLLEGACIELFTTKALLKREQSDIGLSGNGCECFQW